MLLVVFVILVAGTLAGLWIWRLSDGRHAARVWVCLARDTGAAVARFDPSMVDRLPEPARRYLLFAIRPGTVLRTVAEIRMSGELGLGTRERPGYMPMRARQILAPPHGFVWRLDAGSGAMRVTGSDGLDGARSWSRFWLAGLIPVARAGGGPDHARAAFGRVVAEAAFWTPAALLPDRGVTWEAVAHDIARATVRAGDMVQTVDITVAADGRPTSVVIPRWTDANPRKQYRLQPFGGDLSGFREFDGYMLPTRVEGGNFVGTPDYFPFYKARVDAIRFLPDD